jgi:hypothetical protein
MTFLARLVLFATAYAPLLGVLWIRVVPLWFEGAVALLALSVLLVLAGILLYSLIIRGLRFEVTITDAERLSDTAPAFLVGYVLPFLLIDLRDSYAVTASAVFIALLGIAYVRAGILYANPLLALFGLHVWKVRGIQTPGTGAESSFVLISRARELSNAAAILTRGDEDGIRVGGPKKP